MSKTRSGCVYTCYRFAPLSNEEVASIHARLVTEPDGVVIQWPHVWDHSKTTRKINRYMEATFYMYHYEYVFGYIGKNAYKLTLK